jgi:hypothetical protein
MVRLAHHDYPKHVEGPPPPLPCGVCFTTPQGRPSPLRARGSSEPEAVKGGGGVVITVQFVQFALYSLSEYKGFESLSHLPQNP